MLSAIAFPFTNEGFIDCLLWTCTNCWGHYLLRRDRRFSEWAVVNWYATTYVGLLCFSFLCCRDHTVGGLRWWSLSLQAGVVTFSGIHLLLGAGRLSVRVLVFVLVSFILDGVVALFTQYYSWQLDVAAIIMGVFHFSLFFPWKHEANVPAILYTPLAVRAPWLTTPMAIGFILLLLFVMVTVLVFLFDVCCVCSETGRTHCGLSYANGPISTVYRPPHERSWVSRFHYPFGFSRKADNDPNLALFAFYFTPMVLQSARCRRVFISPRRMCFSMQ